MNLDNEFNIIKEGQIKILQQLENLKKSSVSNTIYSLDDLAKFFKVTKRTIYNWKDRGIISCTIIGSKTYVTAKQLSEFLEKHEVKSVINRRN